jgi:hypothetical protein
MPKWSWPLVFIASFWVGLWLLKMMAKAVPTWTGKLVLPLEVRVLSWLQDRATARALGVDLDILRARRKIDFPVSDRTE